MIDVRAMTAADVPAVAELVARSGAAVGDVERLEARLAQVLFGHPWPDPTLPSLVAEDDTGKLQAFLGVIPRPMAFGGRVVRAAVAAPLTIHPDCREFVGLRLLRRFLAGSQELSLMDGGRCATRSVWERLGGSAAFPYMLSWTRPLRPASWALGRLGRSVGAVAALGRPLARVVDAAIARMPASPLRLPSRLPAVRVVGEDELRVSMDEVAGTSLHARHDGATLRWLLARAEERAGAPLYRLVIDGRLKGTRGWCVLATPRGGVAQVLDMAARVGEADDVIRAVLRCANDAGCVAVTGRVDPRFLIDLTDRGAIMHATGTQVLVHSTDAALARHVERGDALLGRLDGEWWLSV